jgi:hypothetical protein
MLAYSAVAASLTSPLGVVQPEVRSNQCLLEVVGLGAGE